MVAIVVVTIVVAEHKASIVDAVIVTIVAGVVILAEAAVAAVAASAGDSNGLLSVGKSVGLGLEPAPPSLSMTWSAGLMLSVLPDGWAQGERRDSGRS